jgi:hypothetical protein
LPDRGHADYLSKVEYKRMIAEINKDKRIKLKPPFTEEIKRKMEPRLQGEAWKRMKKAAPNLYKLVVINVWVNRYLKELVEDVENSLKERKLSWVKLEALKHIDSDLVTAASGHESEAREMDKLRRRVQRKHEECGEFIRSRDCLFSKDLKRQVERELKNFKRWLEEFEKRTAGAAKQRANEALEKLAGKQKKILKQEVTTRFRQSAVFNALIVSLVDELMSAGFSKKESYEITDWILKALYPFYWRDVDEYSFNRVRQRYEYWLKNKKR